MSAVKYSILKYCLDAYDSRRDLVLSPIPNDIQGNGGYHQHNFTMRIDWMLDGHQNSLVEVNCETIDDELTNPFGNAWVARETVLRTISESRRIHDARKARYWKVVNSQVTNHVDMPVGYKLVPLNLSSTIGLHQVEDPKCTSFTHKYHIYADKFINHMDHAIGSFGCRLTNEHENQMVQHGEKTADDCLVDCDLITWITMQSTNVLRLEDWPTLSTVENIGFRLVPVGFFSGNPALDVPRPKGKQCQTL
jgi:primary-amine oxidase